MTIRPPKPGPREPRPLGELIDSMSTTSGWGNRLALGRLRQRWAEVAGNAVAAHSEPVKLDGGVLTIRAEAGAWATELTLLASTLASKADEALGGRFVREVRVVASGAFEPGANR